MRIGTSFYEKCVSPKNSTAHLESLAENGFSHLEFTLHPNLITVDQLKTLHRQAESLQFSTAFHSPDFLDPQHYGVALFDEGSGVRSHYKQLIHQLADLPTLEGQHPLVIHSADPIHAAGNTKKAHTNNYRFFDWIANETIKNNLPLSICLENTCSLDDGSTINNADHLMDFFRTFEGAPLHLCFDLAHWWRQCQLEMKDVNFCFTESFASVKDRIIYAHLHGFDATLMQSHIRINSEQKLYLDFVKRFYTEKKQINFNLEIFEIEGFENFATFETLLFEQFRLIVDKCRN